MAKQTINIGTIANDGTGDKLRTAFTKINQNFDEVYSSGVGAQGTVGAQGAPGVQGAPGANGSTGMPGATGAAGAQGAPGVQGATGSPGAQGATGTGAQGTSGVQGAQGEDGVMGPIGEQGLVGEAGPQGVQGPQGSTGAPGAQGAPGVQGAIGVQGTTGSPGAQGETGSFGGASFNFNYLDDTSDSDPGEGKLKFNNATLTSATVMYIDDLSANSADIQTFLRAIDESTSAIKGNFRISETSNVDSYVFYAINDIVENTGYFTVSCAHVANSVATLANNTSIVATFARTGDKGDTGSPGAQGAAGAPGAQGPAGTGAQGAPGSPGAQGAVGAQGPGVGSPGAQGASGAQGAAGSPGSPGAPGEGGNISYELVRNLSLATGTVTHDCDNGNVTVFVHSQMQANITANFTNALLPANSAIGLTIVIDQGGTGYLPTAVQLDGQAQTLNWLDGVAPAGNANKKDIISYSIINQNGTTNTVFASLASFG